MINHLEQHTSVAELEGTKFLNPRGPFEEAQLPLANHARFVTTLAEQIGHCLLNVVLWHMTSF